MINYDKFITKTEDEMMFEKYKKNFSKFDDAIISVMVDLQKTKEKEIVFKKSPQTTVVEKKESIIYFD